MQEWLFQFIMRLRWKFGKFLGFKTRTRIFFTVIIYNTDHSFTVHESILPYLPKWKLIRNVRWPRTMLHVCTEGVMSWISFIVLLQRYEKINIRLSQFLSWEVSSLYSPSPVSLCAPSLPFPSAAVSSECERDDVKCVDMKHKADDGKGGQCEIAKDEQSLVTPQGGN